MSPCHYGVSGEANIGSTNPVSRGFISLETMTSSLMVKLCNRTKVHHFILTKRYFLFWLFPLQKYDNLVKHIEVREWEESNLAVKPQQTHTYTNRKHIYILRACICMCLNVYKWSILSYNRDYEFTSLESSFINQPLHFIPIYVIWKKKFKTIGYIWCFIHMRQYSYYCYFQMKHLDISCNCLWFILYIIYVKNIIFYN